MNTDPRLTLAKALIAAGEAQLKAAESLLAEMRLEHKSKPRSNVQADLLRTFADAVRPDRRPRHDAR